jgi:hypothetical protein
MSQDPIEARPVPDPRVLEGRGSLGIPSPLTPTPPFDTRTDGIDPQVINPVTTMSLGTCGEDELAKDISARSV